MGAARVTLRQRIWGRICNWVSDLCTPTINMRYEFMGMEFEDDKRAREKRDKESGDGRG
jgi:hypothetical protein